MKFIEFINCVMKVESKYTILPDGLNLCYNCLCVKFIRCITGLCFILLITKSSYINPCYNTVCILGVIHVIQTTVIFILRLLYTSITVLSVYISEKDKLILWLVMLYKSLLLVTTELFGLGCILIDLFSVLIEFYYTLFTDKCKQNK